MVGVTDPQTGKFVKGNKAGGRKPRKVEETYLDAFKSTVSMDDWKAIIEKAVTDAKRGDGMARKFVADYLIGPPIQRNELTGADGAAIKIVVEYADDTPETA